MFSGSLIDRKGVDLLATAFCRLAAEDPTVRLTLMGEGELRPNLEKQLADYGDRVHWVGFQQWTQLPQIYRTADVLCVPSRYDGWALVVPEGLATGLPVISTERTGAALELIRHQENGWLIPPGSEQSLYQSMKQAAGLSSAELRNYSQAAWQTIADHSLKNGVIRFHQAVSATLSDPVFVQPQAKREPLHIKSG
ncbi:MAG: glycosyltransferase family 4 protein [Leptolyngbyaceae cyanobacterium RU_5_1]|nr:glycosyltransferase family 4 protein [Leptolyngbyaceae cyanobacterium RU_5_1]